MTIDQMLDRGEVYLIVNATTNERLALAPGESLSGLPSDIATQITAHWNEDVGGQTRAQRYPSLIAG